MNFPLDHALRIESIYGRASSGNIGLSLPPGNEALVRSFGRILLPPIRAKHQIGISRYRIHVSTGSPLKFHILQLGQRHESRVHTAVVVLLGKAGDRRNLQAGHHGPLVTVQIAGRDPQVGDKAQHGIRRSRKGRQIAETVENRHLLVRVAVRSVDLDGLDDVRMLGNDRVSVQFS